VRTPDVTADYGRRRSGVPLCGHATLAAGAVVAERLEPGRGHVTQRRQSTVGGPSSGRRAQARARRWVYWRVLGSWLLGVELVEDAPVALGA
jgi:hypothetical protein